MKVMVIVKATKESEAGIMPDEKVIAEMGKFKEELVKAKRLHISGGKKTLIHGPFAEAKELVGGYWIWQVKPLDEAVERARRCAPPLMLGVIQHPTHRA